MDKQKKMNENQKPQKRSALSSLCILSISENVSKLGLPSLKPNPINTLTENSEQLSPGHFLLMEITHPMPRSDLPSLYINFPLIIFTACQKQKLQLH